MDELRFPPGPQQFSAVARRVIAGLMERAAPCPEVGGNNTGDEPPSAEMDKRAHTVVSQTGAKMEVKDRSIRLRADSVNDLNCASVPLSDSGVELWEICRFALFRRFPAYRSRMASFWSRVKAGACAARRKFCEISVRMASTCSISRHQNVGELFACRKRAEGVTPQDPDEPRRLLRSRRWH